MERLNLSKHYFLIKMYLQSRKQSDYSYFQVDKVPPFYWMQGVEDMVVWVMLPEGTTKRDLKVTLKPSEILVKIGNEEKIAGRLWNVLDGDSMTWLD